MKSHSACPVMASVARLIAKSAKLAALKVQQLFETEKSQTEVVHMECKRTGEFAHRESTHYESGEVFNGDVRAS